MKQITKMAAVALLIALFSLGSAGKALAQMYETGDTTGKPGFYVGVGGGGGYEANRIKQAFGGPSLRVGYRLNEQIAIHLTVDGFYTKKSGVTYWMVPVIPTVTYGFYGGAYSYAGFGYELLHASAGLSFNGTLLTAPKNYSGYAAETGFGYEFWISSFTITPEIAFHYARVAGTNLYAPVGRVIASYHF